MAGPGGNGGDARLIGDGGDGGRGARAAPAVWVGRYSGRTDPTGLSRKRGPAV
ncbi:hypothetical protein I551_4778 [Mycobacterium ulcerans str. Harvey]|uniref:Uncharacterized protein n=1 Tax=Mycobacterium ulcerans str. Harvey TaxID=1299332 RepID=A0ABN0QVK1_MYCUL|nr:hypothetical protein I551_4778 [Mycobacterium ulcerans str. Harvey]